MNRSANPSLEASSNLAATAARGAAPQPGPRGPGTASLSWLGQLDALSLFAATLLLLLVIGSVTRHYRPGPAGVALTEVFAILLPALLWSRTRRRHVVALLGLKPFLLRQILGGALLGASLFLCLAVFIEPLLDRVFPVSLRERQQLLQLLAPPSGLRPLWQDLLCFAAAPAVCEEVLFRGAILAALLGRASLVAAPTRERPALAVLLCALLFGAFHLSWAKLLPTTILGLGFGIAAVRSRSLWPAVCMHLVNNGLVIVLVRGGQVDPQVPLLSPLAALTAAAAAALLAAGAWLSRPPAAPDESGQRA